jgi:hypothetical protein
MRHVIAAASDRCDVWKTTSAPTLTAALSEPEPGVPPVDLGAQTNPTERHEGLCGQASEAVPSYGVALRDCPPSLGPVIHCAQG